MGYTKRQFVVKGYSKIGYASYEYDLTPDDLNEGLEYLDMMMAEWYGLGIRIGYPLTVNPEDSSLDTETNVPSYANLTIVSNLAKLLAPTVGKVTSKEINDTARKGYLKLLARATQPNAMQLPGTLPRGAGQKAYRYNHDPFIDTPTNSLATGYDDVLDLLAS